MSVVSPPLALLTAHSAGWDTSIEVWTTKKWLDSLLTFQASPRLREIRLELEVSQSKVEHELRPYIAGIREHHAQVERVDEFGNQVCVELQDEMPEMTWTQFEEPRTAVYTIVTLIWKVVPVKDAPIQAEEVQEVPELIFSDAEKEPLGAVEYHDAEALRQVEERWEREGSLLRFVSR